MRKVFDLVGRVADAPAPVLVLGETGTGKGLVAEELHVKSRRSRGPFVVVNCAALPEPLLESELFGHVRGAFSGACSSRAGLFAEARGGTLFLDEVGEMAPTLQAKLLSVIERGRVRPVGGVKEQDVDVRIVAATNRNLNERAREGAFREDLLYRLDVVSIELSPLRSRPEDIPPLCDFFLRKGLDRYPHSAVRRLSREALARLIEWSWPGNVRELSHVIERLLLLGQSEEVRAEDISTALRFGTAKRTAHFQGEVLPMREMQQRYAAWAFEELGRCGTRTAEKLGVDPKTLRRLLGEARELSGHGQAADPDRAG